LKTRGISPARKSRSDTGFALLSLWERSRARSALLTVFLPLSLRPVFKKLSEKRSNIIVCPSRFALALTERRIDFKKHGKYN